MNDTWQQEAEELRRLAPRHLLFLCVANSARSQLAEGVARSLAPAGVTISSAGSRPSQVNPLAVQALAEVGIDANGQFSKSVDTIPPEGVEVVITLCAEEECPVFLGKARRIHWGLPDPGGAGLTDEQRLQSFRDVRDELKRRLSAVFPRADAGAVRLAPASGDVLEEIRGLLHHLDLPASDLGLPNQTIVAARAGAELVGCVGLERYGTDALLRSLAVVPRLQGTGLGKRLYGAVVEEARRGGVQTLWLLTTTAAPFFARAGFEQIERSQAPAAVAGSTEFKSLCPASAVCMRLQLA